MPLYNEAASNLNRNQGGNTSTTEGGNTSTTEGGNTSTTERGKDQQSEEEMKKIEEEIDISNNHQQTNFDDDILNDAFDVF